ncbi:MAG: hypothetical protein JWN52_7584 [Actinomycetia bacterium]|nr:hypothetical protein [Actinomycetes bacterium]
MKQEEDQRDNRWSSRKRLPVSYDGQQLQLLVAFGPGGGGVDEEGLGLVGVEEDLAVQFEDAEVGVLDAFGARSLHEMQLVTPPR